MGVVGSAVLIKSRKVGHACCSREAAALCSGGRSLGLLEWPTPAAAMVQLSTGDGLVWRVYRAGTLPSTVAHLARMVAKI